MAIRNHFNEFPTDMYGMFDQLRYDFDDMPRSSQGRIAIVGLPDAGKETLYNYLYGWKAVHPNDEDTRELGMITLLDLPTDPYDVAGIVYRLESTELILFVMDSARGLDAEVFNWITRLRTLDATFLVILNRTNRVEEEALDTLISRIENRVARPILPLQGQDKHEVRNQLLGTLLSMCPQLAVPLATEIPSLRSNVARHTVSQYAMTAMSLSLDSYTSLEDPSALIGLQLRMIKELTKIFGYHNTGGFRQRLGLSIVMRSVFKHSLIFVSRFSTMNGWIGAGLVNAMTTLIVGHIMILFYGTQLPRWMVRFTPQAWKVQQSNGQPTVTYH